MQQFRGTQLVGLLGTWTCRRGCSRSCVCSSVISVFANVPAKFPGKGLCLCGPQILWVQWQNELVGKLIGVVLFKENRYYMTGSVEVPCTTPSQTALPRGFCDKGHKRKPFSWPFYALMVYALVKKSSGRSLVSFNGSHAKCWYFGHSERVPHCK